MCDELNQIFVGVAAVQLSKFYKYDSQKNAGIVLGGVL